MYKNLPNNPIICIDMKSFYASCIALLEDLDIYKDAIAIISNFNHPGSIVLAASPKMKSEFGIKTGSRLFEIPRHPSIKLFEPKMSFFLNMSFAITKLISQYVPQESIHVYSIDESFVDLTGTEKLWGNPEDTAKHIQQAIYDQFHIPSAVGMGPNMLISKLALDIEAKNSGFAKWDYDDIQSKLWPIEPLSKMWGIGSNLQKRLNELGIFNVYDLAHSDIRMLEKNFGIIGNQLYYHAWGIDLSTFEEPIRKNRISFGKGQVLMRDYYKKQEILTVLLEMCEDVMRRTRQAGYAARTFSLTISYSKKSSSTGFQRAKTITHPTTETMQMYAICKQIFNTYFTNDPVRQIDVRASNLQLEHVLQLDLFDRTKESRVALGHTMDRIRSRFGATSLLRAVSFTNSGTAIKRNNLLGGHIK